MTDDKVVKFLDAAADYAELAKIKAQYAKSAYLSQPDPPPSPIPNLPVFGQQWRPWANDRLGYGTSTVGSFGCVVTSAAVIVSHATGDYITPGRVNAKMKEVGGFVSGTGLFYFRKLEVAFPDTVRFSHIVGCIDIAAPIKEIDAWLHDGNYCIVRVDFNPRTTAPPHIESHYLPLMAWSQLNDFYWAVDPWIGSTVTLPPAYSEQAGWDAARAIYKVIFYEKI